MTLHQPPDRLDDLLADHLAGTLDSQRGRALSNFRAHLSAPAAPIPISQSRRFSLPNWVRTGVPAALAAGLAVVVTLQFTSKVPTSLPIERDPEKPAAAGLSFEKLDKYEFSRELNGGVAVLEDNTPVRVVRQQRVSHTQWVDPDDKATYSVTEPVEKVGYVRVQPF